MANNDPDILITRIIDSRDTPADWNALEAFAAADPGIYRDLAMAKRDHRLLSLEVQARTGVADRVSAPVHMLHRDATHPRAVRLDSDISYVAGSAGHGFSRGTGKVREGSVTSRSRLVATWSGWAAAAAVTLAVIGRGGGPHVSSVPGSSMQVSPNTQQLAGVVPIGTPDTLTAGLTFDDAQSALNAYLTQGKQDGRVLTQQPMRILAMEQLADGGGYRLVYERPIVESAIVSRPYGLNSSGFEDPATRTRLRMEPLRITPREQGRGEIH